MSQIHLTEEQFAEIKALQEDDYSSAYIAGKLNLRLPAVNVAFKFDSFSAYEAQWQENLREFADEPDDEPEEDDEESPPPSKKKKRGISVPAQRGALRTILQAAEAESDEELVSYKDMRSALGNQIKGLWAMIALLEKRKASLEQQIRTMEDYLRAGVIFAEKHLENGD